MASRSSSTRKPSEGGRVTQQKVRAQPEEQRARAKGGGLRSEPADKPAGPSASTGGRATRAMVRNSANSRSSNAGKKK